MVFDNEDVLRLVDPNRIRLSNECGKNFSSWDIAHALIKYQ